jgi:hypothetical protein
MASSKPEQRLVSRGTSISHEINSPSAFVFQLKEGITGMPTITTKDGAEIFYKDWDSGSPSCSAMAGRDAQMLFFLLNHGYRVIAHDRQVCERMRFRRSGRSRAVRRYYLTLRAI